VRVVVGLLVGATDGLELGIWDGFTVGLLLGAIDGA